MKNCPYCAEEIQDAAIKCKHCKTYLEFYLKIIIKKISIFYKKTRQEIISRFIVEHVSSSMALKLACYFMVLGIPTIILIYQYNPFWENVNFRLWGGNIVEVIVVWLSPLVSTALSVFMLETHIQENNKYEEYMKSNMKLFWIFLIYPFIQVLFLSFVFNFLLSGFIFLIWDELILGYFYYL